MISRISSGSNRFDSSVEPTMSQKTTVRFRRSTLTPRDPENGGSLPDNCDTRRPFCELSERIVATLYHCFLHLSSRIFCWFGEHSRDGLRPSTSCRKRHPRHRLRRSWACRLCAVTE